jgi:hypothetical protein
MPEGELDELVEGELDGLVELDGMPEGKLDGLVEGELDGLVEGKLDGLVEGELDGFVVGELDGMIIQPQASSISAEPQAIWQSLVMHSKSWPHCASHSGLMQPQQASALPSVTHASWHAWVSH